ncbi:MAG: hypothetical protein ACK4KV_13950 [Rhodocyclaceae bacterium]
MQLAANRQRVLATLRQAPLSAYALLDGLREHGVSAPTQVCRVLARCLGRWMTSNAFSLCDVTIERHGKFATCMGLGQPGV